MANKNTNEDSLFQKFLGTHRVPTRIPPGDVAADRKQRAQMKLVDMTPAQKRAELKRLKAKKAAREKARLAKAKAKKATT